MSSQVKLDQAGAASMKGRIWFQTHSLLTKKLLAIWWLFQDLSSFYQWILELNCSILWWKCSLHNKSFLEIKMGWTYIAYSNNPNIDPCIVAYCRLTTSEFLPLTETQCDLLDNHVLTSRSTSSGSPIIGFPLPCWGLALP